MGCHALLQGNLPDPGIEPGSPALQADFFFFPSEPPGKSAPHKMYKLDSLDDNEAAEFSWSRVTVRSVFGNVPRGCHGLGGAGETGSGPLETAADSPHFAHGDVGAVSPPPCILAEPLTLRPRVERGRRATVPGPGLLPRGTQPLYSVQAAMPSS